MGVLNVPHWEAVSPHLRAILTALTPASWLHRFYLAEGTALALQLGHRVSVDLDFFSATDELPDTSRREIVRGLQTLLEFEIIQDTPGSLLFNVGGVAVGFFSYQYPLLESPVMLQQMALAHPVDIGMMKLDAVASRGVRKDFYDLYFIVRQIPLEQLLERTTDKYVHHRDFAMMALAALVDFTVADQQPDLSTTPPVEWTQVRAFFRREAQRIGRDWLEG